MWTQEFIPINKYHRKLMEIYQPQNSEIIYQYHTPSKPPPAHVRSINIVY